MVSTVTAIGLVAALISCFIALPQLQKVLASGNNLSGVAAGTWWLTLVNSVLWAVWAWKSGAWIAAIPSLVTGPASAVILYRLYRDRRERKAAAAPVERTTVSGHSSHLSGKTVTGVDWCPWCFSWAPFGVDGRYGDHPAVGSPEGGEPPAPGDCPLIGQEAPRSRIRRVLAADT